MTDFDKHSDTIDVRDIIARVEALEEEREALIDAVNDAEDGTARDVAREARATWEADGNPEELATLASLLDDVAGCGGDEQWRGDWYPVTFIRDSYFVEAMRELCEDIGDFPDGIPSYYVIDWEATARNLRADYSATEFDGVTFWHR